MSAPADRLERLSLDDGMQNRARTVQSEQNGRRYDLGGLSLAQADAARDGINSKRLRLLPVLSKAVFPEQGYIGFKVLETHELKIPTSGEQGDSSAKSVHCTCSAFVQNSFCPHLPVSPPIGFRNQSDTSSGSIRTSKRPSDCLTAAPSLSR